MCPEKMRKKFLKGVDIALYLKYHILMTTRKDNSFPGGPLQGAGAGC